MTEFILTLVGGLLMGSGATILVLARTDLRDRLYND